MSIATNMKIEQILRRILATGMTQQELADQLGVTQPTITRWLNKGINDLKAKHRDNVLSLAAKMGILSGQGGATVGGVTEIAVPEIDANAGAGGGGVASSVNFVTAHGISISVDAVREQWGLPDGFLGELRMKRQNTYLIEVKGDSMYDPAHPFAPGSLFPGDRVIIDTGDRLPSPPGPFAVWDGVGIVVKLAEVVRNSEPARLRLISRNPLYAPYEAMEDEAMIIGRVRGRISAL